MDQQEVIEKLKLYNRLVQNLIKPSQLFLYGSYAKGTNRPDSDIDVAVIVDHFEGNIIETLTALYKLRRQVDDRIEPVLLDIHSDPSGFAQDIMAHGKVVA